MRAGSNGKLMIDFDKHIPDLNSQNKEKEIFDANLVFDRENWIKRENYIKFVKDAERYTSTSNGDYIARGDWSLSIRTTLGTE